MAAKKSKDLGFNPSLAGIRPYDPNMVNDYNNQEPPPIQPPQQPMQQQQQPIQQQPMQQQQPIQQNVVTTKKGRIVEAKELSDGQIMYTVICNEALLIGNCQILQ